MRPFGPLLVALAVGAAAPRVANAAPSPMRTARAVTTYHDTLLLVADGGAPALPAAEAERFETHASLVLADRAPLRRAFAGLTLAAAERRWAGVVASTMARASHCTIVESAAYRADFERVAPRLPPALLAALWRRAVLEPDAPTLRELAEEDADLSRRLTPEGHAVLGRMFGVQQAGLDPAAELRLALGVPDPSPWTRVRYAEVLRDRGGAALTQARLVDTDTTEGCVRVRGLVSVARNRDASVEERLDALARAQDLVTTLLTEHPGDAVLTALADRLVRAAALLAAPAPTPSPPPSAPPG